MLIKIFLWKMALQLQNRGDLDQMPVHVHSVASGLGLHFLPK